MPCEVTLRVEPSLAGQCELRAVAVVAVEEDVGAAEDALLDGWGDARAEFDRVPSPSAAAGARWSRTLAWLLASPSVLGPFFCWFEPLGSTPVFLFCPPAVTLGTQKTRSVDAPAGVRRAPRVRLPLLSEELAGAADVGQPMARRPSAGASHGGRSRVRVCLCFTVVLDPAESFGSQVRVLAFFFCFKPCAIRMPVQVRRGGPLPERRHGLSRVSQHRRRTRGCFARGQNCQRGLL